MPPSVVAKVISESASLKGYLKHSTDYIDSKYIWVHGSNSLGGFLLLKYHFWHFFALHRERKRCGQVEPSPG